MLRRRKIRMNMREKIVTVTLNPSLDRTLVTHYLHMGYQNHTTENSHLDAAGAGLNISQALNKLSTKTKALVLLGNDATGKAFQMLINEYNFPVIATRVEGQTRSNTIILDTGSGQETQITEEASDITREDIESITNILKSMVGKGDKVVLAGSLPHSASDDTYAWLTHTCKGLGAEVVLSSTGEPLREALPSKPDLVTLTQGELEAYFNIPIRDIRDVAAFARKIHEQGADKVLIGMDKSKRAFLYTRNEQLVAGMPDPEEGTTSGTRHALLAGFLSGQNKRESNAYSLKLGAAAAIYTASQVGNRFGSLVEITGYMENVECKEVDTAADY